MGLVFIFLLLEFLSAPAVVLKGSLPKQFLLRNSSTFLPMNRLKESSLSSLDVQVPILQRSYELDPITAFIPLSVAVSLANISYTNSFGILFGHRVKKSDGIDIHVEGVCEFEYPLSRHQLDSQINKSISYLSRVTSLEPVGCLFPNRSAGVSGWEILAGLALSRFSRHPEEFIFVRLDEDRLDRTKSQSLKPSPIPTFSLCLSAFQLDTIAFTMMKKGLVDLTKVFQNPKLLSSPFVDTTREVSINEGEPSASVSSILLTTPIAINQSYISPNRILPRHIFPPLHDITEGKITQLSHGYRNQLFSRSTTSTPEILRWYDLNLLLSLQEKVDESVLKQLIDILRLEGFGNVTSNRAKLLIGTLKAYLNFDEQ